jgi:hypothetical protein
MTPSPLHLDLLLQRIPGRRGSTHGVIIAMRAGVEVARWEVPFPPARDLPPRVQ